MIVDDHPMLREGVAAVLNSEPDMQLIAEAADGIEAIEMFKAVRPDVILMDLEMPKLCGIQAIEEIRRIQPAAVILVLTTYKGDAQAVRALRAGARGYMLKSALRRELTDGIRALHAGKRCVPPEIAAEIAAHAISDSLTSREVSVLQYVAAGLSNRDVARALAISEDTVKVHMKSIMSKLDAKGRTHAASIAVRRGIISAP
jgi:DNA-binding NarL/FixJ family response regulator